MELELNRFTQSVIAELNEYKPNLIPAADMKCVASLLVNVRIPPTAPDRFSHISLPDLLAHNPALGGVDRGLLTAIHPHLVSYGKRHTAQPVVSRLLWLIAAMAVCACVSLITIGGVCTPSVGGAKLIAVTSIAPACTVFTIGFAVLNGSLSQYSPARLSRSRVCL